MDLSVLTMFIPACIALNMIPGPNNLLSMNNGQRFGFKYALTAGFGRIFAFIIMMFFAATGLATVLYASETLFLIIKVVGAGYLFWMAFQLWHSDVVNIKQNIKQQSLYQLFKQEFLLAAGNPKAILIFTAFLPQFIDIKYQANYQFLILGIIFLIFELFAIAVYACFGMFLSGWFSNSNVKKIFNRLCAVLITGLGAGVLLSNEK
ncbi:MULTISPECIES: LysE family translocator [unclassified Pseudoalteromonas]|uniref:LysE family translocator n=1 Tax=unclassified Pseudoalteromonas TaxID=194690 RepID=UPI0005A91748|nr:MULTISPECIES: LysE family translocator [unclassified Pseudoalteromonas]